MLTYFSGRRILSLRNLTFNEIKLIYTDWVKYLCVKFVKAPNWIPHLKQAEEQPKFFFLPTLLRQDVVYKIGVHLLTNVTLAWGLELNPKTTTRWRVTLNASRRIYRTHWSYAILVLGCIESAFWHTTSSYYYREKGRYLFKCTKIHEYRTKTEKS